MKIPQTLSLLYLAATITAQATQLTELPQCAVGCFQQAVVETTACNPTDTACLCGGDNTGKIEKRASQCVEQNCDNAEEIPALFQEVCSATLAQEQEAGSGEEAAASQGEAEAGTTTPEEAPVEGAPVEEEPVEEQPVEEAVAEKAPVEGAPVEEASTEEAPVEEAPAEEVPVA